MRAACGLRVLVPASLLPATVGAQPPVLLAQWGSPGSGPGQFNEPLRVAVDAAADVYVVDWERESLGGNSRIQKFTGDGTFITQWGSPGSGNGQFDAPPGWRRTWPGNVFVVARLPRRGGRTGTALATVRGAPPSGGSCSRPRRVARAPVVESGAPPPA